MIKGQFSPNGFTVEGHAESGTPGQDIVCAAVSGIVQATLLAMAKCKCVTKQEVNKGKVVVEYSNECMSHNGPFFIMLPMRLGLTEIAKHYPDRVVIQNEMDT